MDREDALHIYTREYYPAIKRTEILQQYGWTWKGIMLTEIISQTEKSKYSLLI